MWVVFSNFWGQVPDGGGGGDNCGKNKRTSVKGGGEIGQVFAKWEDPPPPEKTNLTCTLFITYMSLAKK